MSYRKDALDKIRATDDFGSYYGRFERIEPGEEFTEIIKLDEWYEPLRPVHYELKGWISSSLPTAGAPSDTSTAWAQLTVILPSYFYARFM